MFVTEKNKDDYYKSLELIDNTIRFKPREIDILSCMLNGKMRHKEIARILGINNHKVVGNYISYIKARIGGKTTLTPQDFVEKSDKGELIKEHYKYFKRKDNFEETLKEISRLRNIKSKEISIYFTNDKASNFIFGTQEHPVLRAHLNLSGFKVNYKDIKDIDLLNFNPEENNIFIISDSLTENFHKNKKINDILNLLIKQNNNHADNRNIFLLIGDTQSHAQITNILQNVDYIYFKDNYFFSFFDLLEKMIGTSDDEIQNLIIKFKSSYDKPSQYSSQHIDNHVHPGFMSLIKNKKSLLFIIVTIIITLGGIYKYYHSNYSFQNIGNNIIRSDLSIPPESVLLKRNNIIKKINDRLKSTSGIKTIALTGIIGSGKTTIARYYGKNVTDRSLVWELNAETKDTLIHSFTELSFLLANTIELEKELNYIQQIPNSEIRATTLLNFVKVRLKSKPNWLLIYDNMESFDQINSYFPSDTAQWGNGKVIITTRNEHIKDNLNPEDVIYISELTNEEALNLFSTILYNKNPMMLGDDLQHQMISFLKNIPSFSLDVFLAAYTIKNLDITFDQYIQHLKLYTVDYEKLQARILQEVTRSETSKTPYRIISSKLAELTQHDLNSRQLFFFLCCLESQNISHELLKSYNNARGVENFIYDLRKNGLLQKESNHDPTKKKDLVSVHWSIQKTGIALFRNILSQSEKENFIANMVQVISDFYGLCDKNEDMQNIIFLIPHIRASLQLTQDTNLSQRSKSIFLADLHIILGNANYKWAKYFPDARENFLMVLEYNNYSQHISPKFHAVLLKDLGSLSNFAHNPEEAIEYCNESIAISKNLTNSELIIASNLHTLGSAHGKTNNFSKAHYYFERALNVIPQAKYEEAKDLRAEIHAKLGWLYATYYIHKKGKQFAEQSIDTSLRILDSFKMFDDMSTPISSHISCNAARHQWKYGEIVMIYNKDYNLAKKWVTSANNITTQKCSQDKYLKGRILGSLGEISLRQNNIFEAEKQLTNSIVLIDDLIEQSSAWVNYVLRSEAKIRLGKFEEAYKDCLYVLNLEKITKNNLRNLIYAITPYHAAFIQYKLKNYEKSTEYFVDFIKNMESFCKKFLDQNEYEALVTEGNFITAPYDETIAIKNIRLYLENSLKIFIAIYGNNHPFIKDYIKINAEDIHST